MGWFEASGIEGLDVGTGVGTADTERIASVELVRQRRDAILSIQRRNRGKFSGFSSNYKARAWGGSVMLLLLRL